MGTCGKNTAQRWRQLALMGVLGVFLGLALWSVNGSARIRPSELRVVSGEARVSTYQVKKGYIYANFRLTKIKHNGKNYRRTTFYSNETITVRRPNGKKAVYRTLTNRYGKTFGYIWHGYAKKIKTLKWNFGDYNAPNKTTDNESNFFTADQLQQISVLRAKAKSFNNSAKNIYAVKPSLSGTFQPGVLTPTYIQATVNWINFYRNLYNLPPITANADWNTSAQYGAATLAAVNKGLSHGLVGFTKPSNVSATDWQKGIDATASSNLGMGAVSPGDTVSLYLQDSGNDIPGHREWLLGGITQVGVGQVNAYNDLKVFGQGSNNYVPSKALPFPNAGVFPFEVSLETRWSLTLPQPIASTTNPSVKVYDKTAKTNVNVHRVKLSKSGYGEFSASLSYEPDSEQVKTNHTYTITISNISGGQPDVTYTTTLFTLDKD